MIKQDFVLRFFNNKWVCEDDTLKITADSLEDIDDKLEEILKQKFSNIKVEVIMYFDFDYFPDWHRQYMPHYFNRNWTIDL